MNRRFICFLAFSILAVGAGSRGRERRRKHPNLSTPCRVDQGRGYCSQ